jgi:DNA-binding MarR family transcriptional regulator
MLLIIKSICSYFAQDGLRVNCAENEGRQEMQQPSREGVALCHCAALRRAARRISQFYDDKLAPTGLRIGQYGILATLHQSGEVSVNELAGLMELDRTTMGKNLRPLERDGLIAVGPSASDGRTRAIKLTAEGTAALKAGAPLWREAQKAFEASNGAEASAALRDALAGLKIGA